MSAGAILAGIAAGVPAVVLAQETSLTSTAAAVPLAETLPRTMPEIVQYPGYNSIYCAGFISDRKIEQSLFIIAGEEGGMKNEFVPGDAVYFSKGKGWIVNPSGEYLVIRPVKDFVKMEIFKDQFRYIETLGQVYQEIGRVRVNIVHEKTVTAHVLHACESITVGDLVIPFNVRPAPPLKPSAGFDRFAPPTGRNEAMIVTGKEFVSAMATGEVAYIDIGAGQGVRIGQYYRIFRPYENYRTDRVWKAMGNYPEKATGVRLGYHLTREQMRGLPREVVGEMVITHVEGRSATGLITYSHREIFVGDWVELE